MRGLWRTRSGKALPRVRAGRQSSGPRPCARSGLHGLRRAPMSDRKTRATCNVPFTPWRGRKPGDGACPTEHASRRGTTERFSMSEATVGYGRHAPASEQRPTAGKVSESIGAGPKRRALEGRAPRSDGKCSAARRERRNRGPENPKETRKAAAGYTGSQ